MSTPKVRVVLFMLVAVSLMTSSSTFAQQLREQPQLIQEDRGPKKDKIDVLYKASRLYLLGGTGLDMVSTARLMSHPTVARTRDGSVLARYHGVETGWARRFGRRNAFAAVGANAALNAGIDLLSRRLYRRGGRWRILAVGVNLLKGTDSLAAGIRNIRHDPDASVRKATGYSGKVVWSSR